AILSISAGVFSSITGFLLRQGTGVSTPILVPGLASVAGASGSVSGLTRRETPDQWSPQRWRPFRVQARAGRHTALVRARAASDIHRTACSKVGLRPWETSSRHSLSA